MKTELIRIGNSRGIRIPKPIIEQCGLGDTVELRVEDDGLIISSQRSLDRVGRRHSGVRPRWPRTNSCWNPVLDDDFDREEWTW